MSNAGERLMNDFRQKRKAKGARQVAPNFLNLTQTNMNKQEFQQLTIRQELDYIKQIVGERYAGKVENLSLTLNKYIIGKRTIALAISWKLPTNLYDFTEINYFKNFFEGLVPLVSCYFDTYVTSEHNSILHVHFFLYY